MMTKLFCFSVCIGLFAQGQTVKDPGIPHGEKTTYKVTVGNKNSVEVQRVHVSREDGQVFYVVDRHVEAIDTQSKASKADLRTVYSKITQRTPEAHIIRETRFESVNIPVKAGEVAVLDFTGIDLMIRGLDLEGRKSVSLRFAGTGSETPFKFEIQDGGTETLHLAGREWACRKLILAVTGFWSAFIPKSALWVDQKGAHCLVKYDGVQGLPGSPRRVMEIASLEMGP